MRSIKQQLSDETGAITDTYTYDAYGKTLQATGSTENNYLYRGEQTDSVLGLQYLRARYYDQNSGRFASTDPFDGLTDQPLSRHRYIYGNDNPISYSDPSGEFSLLSIEAALAILGTLATATVAQYSVGRFLDGFSGQKPVKWDGIQTSGSIGGLAPFTSILGNLVFAKSSCAPNEGRYQTYQGFWLIVGESISASVIKLPASFTAGLFSATSPGLIGPNPIALQRGYLQTGLTIATGYGFATSAFIMGYGSGRSLFGLSFGVRNSLLGVASGLSISLGGEYDNCEPTPQK